MLAAKKPEDQLFETMDATDLNKTLKDLMDGLSVKVFRTYNASITLDRLLWEPSDSQVVDAKKADYDRANKEVRNPCCSQAAKGVAVNSAAICAFDAFAGLVCALLHLHRFLEDNIADKLMSAVFLLAHRPRTMHARCATHMLSVQGHKATLTIVHLCRWPFCVIINVQ